jgi:hypothetical protein
MRSNTEILTCFIYTYATYFNAYIKLISMTLTTYFGPPLTVVSPVSYFPSTPTLMLFKLLLFLFIAPARPSNECGNRHTSRVVGIVADNYINRQATSQLNSQCLWATTQSCNTLGVYYAHD